MKSKTSYMKISENAMHFILDARNITNAVKNKERKQKVSIMSKLVYFLRKMIWVIIGPPTMIYFTKSIPFKVGSRVRIPWVKNDIWFENPLDPNIIYEVTDVSYPFLTLKPISFVGGGFIPSTFRAIRKEVNLENAVVVKEK